MIGLVIRLSKKCAAYCTASRKPTGARSTLSSQIRLNTGGLTIATGIGAGCCCTEKEPDSSAMAWASAAYCVADRVRLCPVSVTAIDFNSPVAASTSSASSARPIFANVSETVRLVTLTSAAMVVASAAETPVTVSVSETANLSNVARYRWYWAAVTDSAVVSVTTIAVSLLMPLNAPRLAATCAAVSLTVIDVSFVAASSAAAAVTTSAAQSNTENEATVAVA